MEEKHLDKTGLSYFWSKLKTILNGKADKSVSFTVILNEDGWADNTQAISDARFLAAGYSYIVSPASANFTAYGEAGIYADDVTTDGQMVFHCDSVPDQNISVSVVAMMSV